MEGVAEGLRALGFEVHELFLGDYLTLYDEITLTDLGQAMTQALTDENATHGLGLERHSFDMVVHSTGALVVREFLRQFCRDEADQLQANLTPVRNCLMLAAANFGSYLASKGKSFFGRFAKGWKWDGFFQSGERILDALELASPYTFALAEDDLFSDDFPLFDPANVRATVLVGTTAFGGLGKVVHEPGSDNTVRVATANLNARHLRIDYADPENPALVETSSTAGPIAFAVLDTDHSTIKKPAKLRSHRAQ